MEIISIISLVISVLILLVGNNLLGRLRSSKSKESKGKSKLTTTRDSTYKPNPTIEAIKQKFNSLKSAFIDKTKAFSIYWSGLKTRSKCIIVIGLITAFAISIIYIINKRNYSNKFYTAEICDNNFTLKKSMFFPNYLLNKNGDRFTKSKYLSAQCFREGLAPILSADRKWGYINEAGIETIRPKYDHASQFNNGIALVGILTNEEWEMGYISKKDSAIVPVIYEPAIYNNYYTLSEHEFSEGLALICNNGKCGYIDNNGKVVIPLKFDSGKAFKFGKGEVRLDSTWFYIDKKGNCIDNCNTVPFYSLKSQIIQREVAKAEIVGSWAFKNIIGTNLEKGSIHFKKADDYSISRAVYIRKDLNYYFEELGKWNLMDNKITFTIDSVYNTDTTTISKLDSMERSAFNEIENRFIQIQDMSYNWIILAIDSCYLEYKGCKEGCEGKIKRILPPYNCVSQASPIHEDNHLLSN